MRAPFADARIDITAAAALTLPAAADRAPDANTVVRWFEMPVLTFPWDGLTAYITPADMIALAGAVVLFIRFAVWFVQSIRPITEKSQPK